LPKIGGIGPTSSFSLKSLKENNHKQEKHKPSEKDTVVQGSITFDMFKCILTIQQELALDLSPQESFL